MWAALGKTELLGRIGCSDVIKGKFVGYFAPDYKRMLPFYKFCAKRLLPVTVTSSQQSGIITAIGGGSLEHWTLNDPHAGRFRKYHTVLIDEAAFAGPEMMDIWRNAIKPTLLDYNGRCIVASNTNGIDQEQWFWKICNGQMEGTTFRDGDLRFNASGWAQVRCAFHEEGHASLSIHRERGAFRCFACDARGGDTCVHPSSAVSSRTS